MLNPDVPVIGTREGSDLILQANSLFLIAELDGVIFHGQELLIIPPRTNLTAYLPA